MPTGSDLQSLHRAAMRIASVVGRPASGLPDDHLAKARRRVTSLAATSGVSTAIAFLVVSLVWADGTRPEGILPAAATLTAAMAGLWLYCRRPEVPDRAVLRVSLIVHVLSCWFIQFGAAYGITASRGVFPELTFASVLIVGYPLVVPATPRAVLRASVVAALAIPLSTLFVRQTLGVHVGPGATIWASLLATFAGVIAWLGTRSIHDLGTEVRRARRLGAYELVERIGAGGMGEVWRARHQLLVRDAAVKLIAAGTGAQADLLQQRFAREAKATAALDSPHTIRVYDFGVSPEGAFYYVMELLDGVDLDTLVSREGPQPAARVVHMLKQVCHSLAEAHARGMVHRDIKPANLFLCRQLGGDHDVVKVLDFGIVALGRRGPDTTELTGRGHLTGTVAFMSPEALDGAELDGRADLYALGCVAWWLLTGERLFGGGSPASMIAGHIAQTPPAPSARARGVPPALDGVVLACLAKRREDRPATAAELARLLDAAVDARWTARDAEAWGQPPGGAPSTAVDLEDTVPVMETP